MDSKDLVFCSLGNYCITSFLLKDNNLKTKSYPFDWMCTTIDNLIHIFSDNFKNFLDNKNYIRMDEKQTKNKYYFTNTKELWGNNPPYIISDHMHHNLLDDNDYNYLLRCIERFNNLKSYKEIRFIMIQPLYLNNKSVDNNKYIQMYNLLTDKFGKKIKLFIFNIIKKENHLYNEEKIIDNIYLFELETTIEPGPHGMDYFDGKGIDKFLNIIRSNDY
jgi:hypothetical protein